MRAFFFLFLLAAGAASAQTQDVQRAVIQRDQQSAAFALQLQQSQEALRTAPASRATTESRQLWDRQRLDNLSEKQLLEIRSTTPETLRPFERQKAEAERLPLRSPIVEVPVQQPSPPPALQPSLKGNVELIEAPR